MCRFDSVQLRKKKVILSSRGNKIMYVCIWIHIYRYGEGIQGCEKWKEIGNDGHSVFVKKYCLGKISILNHHIFKK